MSWMKSKYNISCKCGFFEIYVQWKVVSKREPSGYEFTYLGKKSKQIFNSVDDAKLNGLLSAKRNLVASLLIIEKEISLLTNTFK
jgi:hypothetical protein